MLARRQERHEAGGANQRPISRPTEHGKLVRRHVVGRRQARDDVEVMLRIIDKAHGVYGGVEDLTAPLAYPGNKIFIKNIHSISILQ